MIQRCCQDTEAAGRQAHTRTGRLATGQSKQPKVERMGRKGCGGKTHQREHRDVRRRPRKGRADLDCFEVDKAARQTSDVVKA